MRSKMAVLPLAMFAAGLLALGAPAGASSGQIGFGFHASQISGAPTGSVRLTGGGSFNPTSFEGHGSGGFRCLTDVNQGPLAGCAAGQGVRWDTPNMLRTTNFKCGTDPLKPIATDAHTAVFQADFYRAGDANEESFTAPMIVADHDIADDVAGFQNVWIMGVGCADANVHFG